MDSRRIGFILLATLSLTLAGCGKSDSKSAPSSSPSTVNPQPSTVSPLVQIHWLGKKRLAADTNAAGFMAIWNLPESAKLEAQTLDKFSTAPWRLLRSDLALSNAPSALLRPLLDDLVAEESHLEIRGDTNQPGELVFAIRLNAERAALWQTNLATVMESLTDAKTTPTSAGWTLKFTRKTESSQPATLNHQLTLTRSGEWTLLGLAADQNTLLPEFITRIKTDHAPGKSFATNTWLDAELDLPHLSRVFSLGWNLPADWPAIAVALASDGEALRTRGRLKFPQPLPFMMEPWNIPTNLIHDPLVSFTAVRGLSPWLSAWPVWKNLQLGPPPNQVFVWAMQGFPLQTSVAAPFTDASNRINQLTESLVQTGSPWLKTNGMGAFERTIKGNGISWQGLPFMEAHLQSLTLPGGDFAYLELLPNARTNRPPPAELLAQILSRTNLVYYDWEISGPRIDAWIYIAQTFRLGLKLAQFPPESVGGKWFQTIQPQLGNSVTAIAQSAPDQLSFTRRSSFGLTAVEIHLLADWLESPEFPHGTHTGLVPVDRPRHISR